MRIIVCNNLIEAVEGGIIDNLGSYIPPCRLFQVYTTPEPLGCEAVPTKPVVVAVTANKTSEDSFGMPARLISQFEADEQDL